MQYLFYYRIFFVCLLNFYAELPQLFSVEI